MSSSKLTELALENTLKEFMKKHPINKITVTMITTDCGVSRHTFYNHFNNVYELLGILFEHEVINNLSNCCNIQYWKQGVLLVLHYTLENKIICLNTYRSLGREHLELFLYKIFKNVLNGVLKDITQKKAVDFTLMNDIEDFFAHAIVGQFLAWLNKGLIEKPDSIADRIERMMDGTIINLIRSNEKNNSNK